MFYVYEHFCPKSGEVVYVGKGTHGRAWSFQKNAGQRSAEHYSWAADLMYAGYTPDQFVRIRHNNLTSEEAIDIEHHLIDQLVPRYNRKGGIKEPALTDDEVEYAKCRRAEGASYESIADELGVSRTTVSRRLQDKTWRR